MSLLNLMLKFKRTNYCILWFIISSRVLIWQSMKKNILCSPNYYMQIFFIFYPTYYTIWWVLSFTKVCVLNDEITDRNILYKVRYVSRKLKLWSYPQQQSVLLYRKLYAFTNNINFCQQTFHSDDQRWYLWWTWHICAQVVYIT